MAGLNNDIEKYLRGELTPSEMHALEQKALHDPFLAEALEGAEHAGAEDFSLDLATLHHSIHERSKKRARKTITLNGWGLYSGIAAGLLLLAVSTYIILVSIKQEQTSEQAMMKEPGSKIASPQKEKQSVMTDSLIAMEEKTQTEGENRSTREAEKKKQVAKQFSKPKREIAETDVVASGPVAQAPLETVSSEGFTKNENEKVVIAELSEPPVIVKDEDLSEDNSAVEEKAEESRAKRKISPAETGATHRAADLSTSAGERIVRGKVINPDGAEIPGVNVLIKGTTHGTVTDAKGNFEIPVTSPTETLAFFFIGYSSQEVPVKNLETLNVQMVEDVTALSEVVVTGYSTQEEPAPAVFEMAEPIGGRKMFNKYLEEQLQYPKQALENKIEGKVTIQFTVEPNGQLTNFKVLRSLGYGCDEEAVRLIKEGPKWIPSRRGDQSLKENVKVRLKFEHPDK